MIITEFKAWCGEICDTHDLVQIHDTMTAFGIMLVLWEIDETLVHYMLIEFFWIQEVFEQMFQQCCLLNVKTINRNNEILVNWLLKINFGQRMKYWNIIMKRNLDSEDKRKHLSKVLFININTLILFYCSNQVHLVKTMQHSQLLLLKYMLFQATNIMT